MVLNSECKGAQNGFLWCRVRELKMVFYCESKGAQNGFLL